MFGLIVIYQFNKLINYKQSKYIFKLINEFKIGTKNVEIKMLNNFGTLKLTIIVFKLYIVI